MIEIDLAKDTLKMDGNLGRIYQELAVIVMKISENRDLGMSTDDVIEMIKEEIVKENK